jgi:SHS family sialic acid transporter-like MFS transporter
LAQFSGTSTDHDPEMTRTEASMTTVSDRGKWMALIAALLGWLFDGFEIGLFPLVGPSALDELLHTEIAANPAVKGQWFGVIMAVFLVGAATGGVLFGWLGDRLGRVRGMSFSIATYAIFTGLCGFATEAWQIALLRFIAALGMGGEWSLGVALLNEVWPDRSRACMAGLIGAAANVGMLLVGILSLVLVSLIGHVGDWMGAMGVPTGTQEYLLSGDGWRLLMMAGALPAVLVFFVRLMVPESEKWTEQRNRGGTAYWANRDLIGVLVGGASAAIVIFLWSPAFESLLSQWSTASVDGAGTRSIILLRLLGTTLGLVAALLGYMFPVMQYLRRSETAGEFTRVDSRKYLARMMLGASLAGVALLGTWGSLQWAPKWAIALAKETRGGEPWLHAKEYTQISLATGAILGTIAAAWLAGRIGRRATYVLMCLASFTSLVALYQIVEEFGVLMLTLTFFAGATTAAFYGWFPLYFPELFPTNIRATSQGFAFNFGRVLSAVGALQTASLTAYFAHGIAPERIELEAFPHAGSVLAGIYLIGVFLIWLGPETKDSGLPD